VTDICQQYEQSVNRFTLIRVSDVITSTMQLVWPKCQRLDTTPGALSQAWWSWKELTLT